MAYSQEWLESPTAIRGVLVEVTVKDVVNGIDVTKYLSNIGYLTEDAITSYLPVIAGTVQVTETLSIDGSTSMSFGDIEILNVNGELDDWLDSTKYIWVNRNIQIYYGDPSWVCTNLASVHATFEKVFDGVVADIDSKAANRLNIKVRDKLERLNTAITEHKLGTYGTWGSGQTNQDTIIPLVFGEVHNVQPLLIDPSQLEYSVNDGSTERLIEVRDNGMPIFNNTVYMGASVNLTTGKFKLSRALAGTCTVSIQGVKQSINLSTGNLLATYNNNIANLVALIVTQYGKSSTRFSSTDLDLVNLNNFATSNTQSVGIVVTDRTNVLVACQQLADSIGAQIFMTRKGLLQLLRLGVPTSDTSVSITSSDIIFNSLSITNRSLVVSSTSLGYCKNFTVQDPLLTAIPTNAKDLFAKEWLPVTVTDTSVNNNYLLSTDPIQKDTALQIGTEALAEATRLNNFFKVPRTTFTFTGTAKLLSLKLGQQVTLTHPRFGLSQGKTGQVIGLTPNWSTSTIVIEVLI